MYVATFSSSIYIDYSAHRTSTTLKVLASSCTNTIVFYYSLELLEPISIYDTSVGNTSGLSIIPVFNGDDFREWKRKVLAYLNLAKAAYALTNTMPQTIGTGDSAVAPDLEVVKEWKTSNTQALGLFQLKLSPTLQWIIKDTAKET
ncbi:gag-pol polyprotein [Moniliophthora roreri]|nr:gag-pol polyprotein [Moniliophthora roreri]